VTGLVTLFIIDEYTLYINLSIHLSFNYLFIYLVINFSNECIFLALLIYLTPYFNINFLNSCVLLSLIKEELF